LTIEDILTDRQKMMKLFWIGLISSLVFIVIGAVYIIMALV
jgi:hypothetical protein